MPSTSHPPQAENAPHQQVADQFVQDGQYYRRVLHDLIEIGADFARMLHQQAKPNTNAAAPANDQDGDQTSQPAPDPAATQALSIAFDRVARAVRRTIALAHKLSELRQAGTDHAATSLDQRTTAARKRVIRDVEDTIQRAAPASEFESLQAELLERLDDPDFDDEILHRPTAEIIAEICRDLGIAAAPGTRPWKRRTPQDIAILSARATAPCRIRPVGAPSATSAPAVPQAAPTENRSPSIPHSATQRPSTTAFAATPIRPPRGPGIHCTE